MAEIKVYDALTGELSKHTITGVVLSVTEARNGFGFAQIKLQDGQIAHKVCVKLDELSPVAAVK